MVLYGSTIWFNALQYEAHRQPLKQHQRCVGLMTTKCLHTTSYESITILSKMKPIIQRAKQLAANGLARQLKNPKINRRLKLQETIDLQRTHPTNKAAAELLYVELQKFQEIVRTPLNQDFTHPPSHPSKVLNYEFKDENNFRRRFKSHLKKVLNADWNHFLTTSTRASTTRNILGICPIPDSKKITNDLYLKYTEDFNDDVITNQILSGHYFFLKTYRYKFGRETDQICHACEETDTIDHMLKKCTIHEAQRKKNKITDEMTIKDILKNNRYLKELHEMRKELFIT